MINLVPIKDSFTIYRLEKEQEIPPEIIHSSFYSCTKTKEEISIVSNCIKDFEHLISNKGWKGFKVKGVLDFSLVGIIHDISKPLKDNGISVFVLSTFNTDYIFVKEKNWNNAISLFKEKENINVIYT